MIKRALFASVLLAASQGSLAQDDYGYDSYGYDNASGGGSYGNDQEKKRLFYAIVGAGAALQDRSWYDGSTSSFMLGAGAKMSDNIAMEMAYNNFGEAEGNTKLGPKALGLAQSISTAFIYRKPIAWEDKIHMVLKWGLEYFHYEVTAPGRDESSRDRFSVLAGYGLGVTFDRITFDLVVDHHKWRTKSELLDDMHTVNVQFQGSFAF